MKMSCADRVAGMREMRATHIILVGKPGGRKSLRPLTRRLEDNNNDGPYSFQTHTVN